MGTGDATEPDPAVTETYEQFHAAYTSLYPATRPAIDRLADLGL